MKTFIKLFFLFLLVLSIVFIVCSGNSSLRIPLKPKNIPKKAFWKGGTDGGAWYYFDKMNGNKYEISIYYSYGKLDERNVFLLIGHLMKQVELPEQFIFYDGNYIYLKNRSYFKKQGYNYDSFAKEQIKSFLTNKSRKFLGAFIMPPKKEHIP